MKDIATIYGSDLVGNDLITYYMSKEDSFYLYFSATHCHNCKDINSLLLSENIAGNYVKLLIDNDNTDEYMDYLEENIGCIKIPTLLSVKNVKVVNSFVGEQQCKEELYNCNTDEDDDF